MKPSTHRTSPQLKVRYGWWARLGAVATASFLSMGLLMAPASSAQASSAPKCKDKTVRVLKSAGFKNNSLRIAWAIVMRESRGENLDESSPYYSGGLGIWQIQTSAWSKQRWWSRSNMLNPRKQSRIVYLHMSNKGTSWRPWGITSDGQGIDRTQYSGWSEEQVMNWIWRPYWQFYQSFPAGC